MADLQALSQAVIVGDLESARKLTRQAIADGLDRRVVLLRTEVGMAVVTALFLANALLPAWSEVGGGVQILVKETAVVGDREEVEDRADQIQV